MNNTFQSLSNFIDQAQKSRKYSPNTATDYRVVLKLVEPELNDEERESLGVLKEHLNPIFQLIFNKKSLSASTVERYKQRLKALIVNYEKYGTDTTKMASWNPKITNIKKGKVVENKQDSSNSTNSPDNSELEESIISREISLNRFEKVFSANRKAIVLTPADLTKEEAIQLKAYIEYLENVSS